MILLELVHFVGNLFSIHARHNNMKYHVLSKLVCKDQTGGHEIESYCWGKAGMGNVWYNVGFFTNTFT